MFVPTREALRTIFPKASDDDIGKYDKQLSKVDDFDPVLIISPNQNWITQNTLQNYQMVMNAFATNRLRPNNRRDENSLCVFHFSTVTELYTVRGNIRRLHPTRSSILTFNINKNRLGPLGYLLKWEFVEAILAKMITFFSSVRF